MTTLQIGDVALQEKEGGLARYFSELLRQLPHTYVGSHGLVVGEPGFSEHDSVTSFARLADPIPLRMLKARRAGLRQMRASSIDLIAAHFAPYALPLLDRVPATPLVVHFHGPWAAESDAEAARVVSAKAKAMIERVVYGRAQRLVVLSECFKRVLVTQYGVHDEKVRVVPGGIDIDRFNANETRIGARERLRWPSDRFIILSVRRQVRRMGLEELIDAAKILIRRHPDVLLLLGGSGSISDALNARIQEHDLGGHVKLVGRIRDDLLPRAFRAADLTVVPSRSLEGFGLVTLESLASGTAVYVTSVGGLPEVIAPFAPTCIFEDSSAQGMARKLGDAITGAEKMPSPQSCRKYAAENYSWPLIASRVRSVYDEALA